MKLNNFTKITNRALKLNKAFYFLMVFIFIFGAYTFNNMTKSMMPEMHIPYVTVVTTMTGASSEDMEEMITEVIEDAISDVKDIEEMNSRSSKNISTIILKFKEGVDTNISIQNIQSEIDKVKSQLPKEATSPMVSEIDINKFPTLLINVPANKPYFKQMKMIDDIKYRLNKIDGISDIEISGLKKPRVNIIPNASFMKKYNITSSMLANIIKDNNLDIPLGEKELNNMRYSFETDNKVKSIKELKNIIILSFNGRIIKLSDIAEIEYEDTSSEFKNYIVKDKKRQSVISLSIYLKQDADAIKVNDQCNQIVSKWNKEHPLNQMIVSLDTSIFIEESINDISTNAFSGILSVIVVLFLFINLKEAIIASLIIPITLISSIILFKPFGLTINMLSIIGLIIALGMLVDNAIVVIEMIDENRVRFHNLSFREVILLSINKVGSAIFSSTITTISAFIPLAFLSGPVGSMVRSIPIAMAISISLSFIVSITLTPVLAYSFLKNFKNKESLPLKIFYILVIVTCALYSFSNDFKLTKLSFIAGFIVLILSSVKLFRENTYSYKEVFNQVIHSIMRSKLMQGLVLIFTISLFVYSISLLGGDKIPKENFPEYDNPIILITLSLIEGIDNSKSNEIFEKADDILRSKDYIDLYTAVLTERRQQYYIELNMDKTIQNKEIFKELTNELKKIPDIRVSIASNNISAAPILIRLTGDNYNDLISEANRVTEILKDIPGAVNPKAVYEYGNPTVKIIIDKEKALESNLLISSISRELRYLLSGEKLINIKAFDENVYAYLKYEDIIHNVSDLKNVSVANTSQKLVPIYDFIDLKEYRTLKTLHHIDGKRILEVKAFNDGNVTVEEIVKEFKDRINKEGGMREGVKYSIAGEYDEMEKSYQDLAVRFIVALVLVYVILLIQFNSFSQPFVIILCVPFSIIGVALGYFFTGLTFSTLTFLGIISLVGIAINDAIVLIDFINQLRKEGMERVQSIIEGSKSRLKPIITTSLTTITGVMPLAIYSPDYSQMAYALIFGLITSTVLTLVVIPTVLNVVEGTLMIFKRKGIKGE